MNILLFVTSLLMILSLLTYARIDSFRYFSGMQSEFERYMRSIERVYINQTAEKWYDLTIARGKGAAPQNPAEQNPPVNPAEAPPSPPIPGAQDSNAPPAAGPVDPNATPTAPPSSSPGVPTSRLSLRVLFDPKMRSANEAAYNQTKELAKKLIKELYGDQLFYKEMVETHGDFLDGLLSAIDHAIQELPEKVRPKEAKDLANLLIDSEFQDAFYLMLKGCKKGEDLKITKTKEEKPRKPIILKEAGEVQDDEEDEVDNENEAIEYLSPQGYDSILNYVSLRNTTKVRVYLASRDLLASIFGETAADAIINMRTSLYRSVKSGTTSAAEATKQFQTAFSGGELDDSNSMLDFKVTKTNPSDYN